ncbi:28742_t:CDS:2, partial [Gigaspora margarita]
RPIQDIKIIAFRSEQQKDNLDKENEDDSKHARRISNLMIRIFIISNISPCDTTDACSSCPVEIDSHDNDSSSESTSSEVKNLIVKMKGGHQLFEYQIVNLSEKNKVDPVNNVFTNADKTLMREFWKKMEPTSNEIKNTVRRTKWEADIKPLIKKYADAIEVKTDKVFVDNNNGASLKTIFESPFVGEFNFLNHYEMLWVQDTYRRFICLFNSPVNILRDSNTSEMAYRDSFVNPIIPKVFDDISDKIRFQVGEIESSLCKEHRNQMREIKPRVCLGSKHDGILKVHVNACEFEIGFLEVVGSPSKTDVKGYYEDLEKLLKGGLHLVDVLTEFTIPESMDQAYVLEEIIKKVYFFKSRIMDYYVKLQNISRKVDAYDSSDEELLLASNN